MTRILALTALLLLTACMAPMRPEGGPVIVVDEAAPVVVMEAQPSAPQCSPGDDGIGGTGCPVQ
jgi:hypothetical protein